MSDLSSIILLELGFAIFIGVAYYGSNRSRFGPRIAREKIPESVIFAFSFVVVTSLNSFAKSDQWSAIKTIIWISCTVLLWIALAVLALRKPQTGKVLLNLGRPNRSQVWALPFLGILGSILLFLAFGQSVSSIGRAEALSMGALAWSLGIVVALLGWKEFVLTEKGIRIGYTGFRWEQIKSYTWAGIEKDHHYLFLKIRHRPPLANTSILDVPDDLRQAVSDIVIEHTSLNMDRQITADNQ